VARYPQAPSAPHAQVRPSSVVGRHDPRYPDLVGRGINARFTPDPDTVRVVATAEQAVRAVQDSVRDGTRLAVRSGGGTASSRSWTTPPSPR
jgi:aclacinomycin oxidase